MIGRTSSPKGRSRHAGQILRANVSGYCESTTLHGFAYWVSAPRLHFWFSLIFQWNFLKQFNYHNFCFLKYGRLMKSVQKGPPKSSSGWWLSSPAWHSQRPYSGSANCYLKLSHTFWNRPIMLTLFSGVLFPTGTMIQAFREAIQ